ncbi:cytochrome c biogenesis protein [Thiothrix eikelboomii]|uniref:Cytochrome c biogenesis protein n=1 Tax=Thiothrix eikelboomii TaxID=92487 RepID=A0A1T4VYU5_9GAMM|nr:cytochrome c biogenesis protein ResB [Thiothrix eikelboomii]SKA69661.1 cytochrome c biogenesis protein [Thiothrix eikelboomii]
MKSSRSTSTRLVDFLGSMNLAITLLVIVAIASVIGTVLKQNQPYPDYEIKFGKFWFEFFRSLGLYDVYSALWFLLILGFLLLSTTTCVIRNTPGILRELRHFREKAQEKSLRALHHSASFVSNQPLEAIQASSQQALKNQGFRFRTHQEGATHVVAAMKGGANKWGYWLTHIGMIVIFIGGLLDSKLPIMLGEWRGTIQPETRNIPASEVPAISQLGANTYSYRGSVDIPEGRTANIIFLPVRDGYLVQRLPYEIEVKAFRVEHYSTGQPKSFESDLVIHDPDLKEPLAHTISVNHPLIYKGTAIYQANFGDGGSEVELQFNPLTKQYAPQTLTGNISQEYNLSSSTEQYRLELDNFRLFNINPVKNEQGIEEQRNIGPSVIFRLRNAAGEAIEYTNYMNPVMIEGRLYLISGVKKSPADPERFLHLPADKKGSPELFLAFLNALQDEALVRNTALATTQASMGALDNQALDANVETQIVESMVRLTQLFATQGFDGIMNDIDARFPEAQRQSVNEAFTKVLQASLRGVYLELLKQRGVSEPNETDWLFFDDSLNAMSNLPFYGSPWFIQLKTFKQIEASGLQITRSPGQNVVYLGCIMLTLGVFLLFYVAQRRIWVLVKPLESGENEVILAGSSNRNPHDFDKYFQNLRSAFQTMLTAKGD